MDGRPRLLEVDALDVHLGTPRRHILKGVGLAVAAGETVGLVGESGSGKSTLAKTLVGVHRPTSGSIHFDGRDCLRAGSKDRARLRREIQYIPQDPYSSLDPRRTIGETIAEALDPRRARVSRHRRRILELLELVRIDGSSLDRRPSEFSGGQRQRIAIARRSPWNPRSSSRTRSPRARPLHPGGGPEPPGGPETLDRPDADLRLPRPGRRPEHQRFRPRAAARRGGRVRQRPGDLRHADSPLHPHADRLGTRRTRLLAGLRADARELRERQPRLR